MRKVAITMPMPADITLPTEVREAIAGRAAEAIGEEIDYLAEHGELRPETSAALRSAAATIMEETLSARIEEEQA